MRVAPRCFSLMMLAAIVGPATAESAASHRQVREIPVKGKSGLTLQTLCPRPDGGVYVLLGASRYDSGGGKNTAEVRAIDDNGKEVGKWAVDFKGQAINVGPDGSVYVGGDGMVAKFDAAGQLLAKTELAFVLELVNDQELLLKQAKEQIQEQTQSYEEMIKEYTDQIETLTKKEKPTAEEKQELRQAKDMKAFYEMILKSTQKQTPAAVSKSIAGRLRIVNGVAATERDLFVVTGESKGYGYAVWRMNPDFTGAKKVLGNLGGCCGQMDVQAFGDELFVAENTKHKVGRYDRDGKKLAAFGNRGRDATSTDCFGGCCNPMNTRVTADGLVYTAESEGHVKAYKVNGDFVGVVGTATLKGGCKNVALAVSPDGQHVYFCDQPGQRVIVLARQPAGE